jgi:hypothetical protein
MANPGADWSDAEVREAVGDYLAMLTAEVAGEAYSKADHRRALLKRLDPSRTPQAVEFKHANISAAMIELGLPYIRGYKPRGTTRPLLRRRSANGSVTQGCWRRCVPLLQGLSLDTWSEQSPRPRLRGDGADGTSTTEPCRRRTASGARSASSS